MHIRKGVVRTYRHIKTSWRSSRRVAHLGMAAAWNPNTADDGASNLWLCSSGGLRVTLLVLRLRAGRYQRKCKHDGRNNGYDCFHASALHELWRIVRWRSGLFEHDVDLRRSNRVGPRANRRNAAPECPLWVKSGHLQRKHACPLYPRKRTCALQLGMSALCQ